jgi:phosphomannomutase
MTMSEAERDLRARAERWIADDVDPRAQDELRAILKSADLSKTDLADRFAGSLEFGTAGLRGVIGAGPNRMNRAVVVRTTLGLARYLLAQPASARSSSTTSPPRRSPRSRSSNSAPRPASW